MTAAAVSEVMSSGRGPRARLLGFPGPRLIGHPATTILALVVIVLIAGAARLVALNQYGFNSDEAVYSGQSAALAGNHQFEQLFGVFRAHPLLVHFLVSLIYRVTGVNDVVPRLFCVACGIGVVLIAGAAGRVAYGRAAALLAMAFVALSSYAVIVSRQMLLDGPMALFFGLTVLFLALYVRRPSRLVLCSAAASAGLAFLAKETAILMVPAIIVFLLTARDVPFTLLDLAAACLVYFATISPFPLSLALTKSTGVAQQFFVWQLFRRPNHEANFYLSTVSPAVGIPLLLLALVGLGMALSRRQGIDVLMVSLTVVTVAFFQIWPVKGFQYLVPLITPIALLASNGAIGLAARAGRLAQSRGWPGRRWTLAVGGLIIAATLSALAAGTLRVIAAPAPTLIATDSEELLHPAYGFVAGTGGLQAARPVGDWIRGHTLSGARFLTIGPSFANIIEFYGRRRAVALAVSPNPLRRNPTYEPVPNPDLVLKRNAIQYLVYDSYSASRTPFFTRHLLDYVKKYHGILVYADYQSARTPDGKPTTTPVVLIYEVHP